MIRIMVGGQIDKPEIAALVEKYGQDQVTYEVKGDLDAAMAMKNGQADYYVGACNTGGGGALAMALALLGHDKCVTLSMPSSMMSEEEIREQVRMGKIAFGFTAQDKDKVMPILMDELLKK